ncbi:MAG: hypothetical protein LAT79_18200, partial [Kiritimatiellae bacterium]|nr:hypothetical protein [Kiritimatiellia bacterium]
MNIRALPIFVLLMMPMLARSQEVWGRQDPKLHSLNEIVDRYLDFREGVWRLNPPIHQTENETVLDEKSTTTSWFEAAWTRWLLRPGWFMRHSGSAGTFSPELQNTIWPKGHTGSLLVWEHPGQGRITLSLEDPRTGEPEELFYVDTTDWTLRSSESVLKFYERELATRRVFQVFRSPYAEPDPEPEPRMMMMTGGGPQQFLVVLDAVCPDLMEVTVEFGEETVTGPLTVWRLDGSRVDGRNPRPGQSVPALGLAERGPGGSLSFSFDPGENAGLTNPLFLRATLGIVDSD